MLVKLMISVNVTNILRANFDGLPNFYVLSVWVCNFLAKGNWRKSEK